jgi:class 3 adenylate cyclase
MTKEEWSIAFGSAPFDHSLATTLLWHFSPWTLKRLHEHRGAPPEGILRPGTCPSVGVLIADLCSFSSYVRDTRDPTLVRRSLTAFYSQARQAIHEAGGMLYQFVGDQVIGVFGFPSDRATYATDAVRCARRLIDIGHSVSDHWQRQIDRVQRSRGVHIGISFGDLELMPLRAFSRTHIGFIGDAVNIAARLLAEAGSSEIVISNSLFQHLDNETQAQFEGLSAVQAKNVGLIQCWKRSATPESEVVAL